jgi:hypothetical protein
MKKEFKEKGYTQNEWKEKIIQAYADDMILMTETQKRYVTINRRSSRIFKFYQC